MSHTMRVRLTAPVGGVTKGLGYLIGSLFVVARSNAAAAAQFTGATAGTWTIVKTAAQAWTQGQKIYWNTGTSKADSDGTTGPMIGVAAVIAANPTSTGRVRLNVAAADTSEGLGLDTTELGYLNGAVPGTAKASKAVVLNAASHIDAVKTEALSLGASGSETLVTATAANLNAVPTATGTGAEIDEMTKNVMSSASTEVLSGSAAIQTCTITAKDADGNTIAAVQRVRVYLATTAAGVTVAAAANGAVAPSTGTILKEHTAKLDWDLLTDVNGVVVLSINNTGGADHYAVFVIVVLPNGKLKASLVTDVRAA